MAENTSDRRPPFGVLLVTGSQTHQENYARGFAADSRCRLIGLTDEPDVPLRRKSLNLQLAAELNVPLLEDFAVAIVRDDVDIVCVCCEPERRSRVVAAAAAAGRHVYIDKPMTTSVDSARQMVDAIQRAGVRSQMFSLVRSPVAQRAKEVVDSGRLGTLYSLSCELMFAKGIAGTADLSQPRQEEATAGNFTFLDSKRELFCVGLYPLVLYQWLTGAAYETVYGTTGNYFFREHQQNNVEDFSSLLLRMTNGVESTIFVGRAGWSSHPSHGVHQIRLTGSEGSILLDAYRPRLEIFSDAPPFQQPARPHPEDPMGFWSSTVQENGIAPKESWWPVASPQQSDMACFVDCIEQDRESDVSALVGARAVEAILAGYRSAAAGQPVSTEAFPPEPAGSL